MRHPKPTLSAAFCYLFITMSLNFFKTKPEKTDASLDYKAVVANLHAMDSTAASLDMDQFVQAENILLGKHQGKSEVTQVE